MSQNYNINMKKFNGTDYDGLLPLAYNALNSQQLDGKTFNEIQNLFDSEITKRSQIATGSYVGNGVYTSPTQINIGFKPKLMFFGEKVVVSMTTRDGSPLSYGYVNGESRNFSAFNSLYLGQENKGSKLTVAMFLGDGTPMLVYMGGTSATPEKLIFNILNITELNGVVSINQNCYVTSRNEQQGSQDFRAAKYQFNEAGKTYYYCAIG